MKTPDKVTMHFNDFPEPECAALYIRRDVVDWACIQTILEGIEHEDPDYMRDVTTCLDQIRAIK